MQGARRVGIDLAVARELGANGFEAGFAVHAPDHLAGGDRTLGRLRKASILLAANADRLAAGQAEIRPSRAALDGRDTPVIEVPRADRGIVATVNDFLDADDFHAALLLRLRIGASIVARPAPI